MADNLPDVYLRFLHKGEDPEPYTTGESLDSLYSREDGWLGIKSFNFGFGWGGSDQADQGKQNALKQLGKGKKLTPAELTALDRPEAGKDDKTTGKGAKTGGADSKFEPDIFNFTRNPGPASTEILDILRTGEEIPKAEVIACRSAGVNTKWGAKDLKIPFVRLLLSKVKLKTYKVTVGKDSPPSETIEFSFKKARLETMWTDNASGEKIPGGELFVEYDFKKQEGIDAWDEEA